ncbi:hypothetical protein CR194_15605 [Salipaludibacillus keqinensis]|jgi:hypothetical protein|uniref:Uncharacterized protein n=1 Tax=Salipaludibacillus keqinensis TaxID=2045207 RepID=A0A323T935_9BACI|nr:hypothetical protein [Salipaludibacillus keqinensis]PYZ92262.1 hypothetical protein CR194_15605 [Salipaludibacillus keqinensis]
MMKLTGKRFIIISLCLLVLVVSLVIMNEYSIHQAQQLCREVGGHPHVNKDIFAINWSFTCNQPNMSVNQ